MEFISQWACEQDERDLRMSSFLLSLSLSLPLSVSEQSQGISEETVKSYSDHESPVKFLLEYQRYRIFCPREYLIVQN